MKPLTRTEWWRAEVHVAIASLSDPSVDTENVVARAVKAILAEQGGFGEPGIRAWRVRCSDLPGHTRFVLQGVSLRRISGNRKSGPLRTMAT
jgi:hypothetical protein